MLFDAASYWGFFALAWAAIRVCPQRWRAAAVAAASYGFYAAWDWRFLGLLLVSTVVDFSAARAIAKSSVPRIRNRWFGLSLAVNLGILATFKYAGFFVDSFSDLVTALGLGDGGLAVEIGLPIGISFYTFQTISYTFDVWRGDQAPEQDFAVFAAFVAFFPQLVAGPIERSRDLLPQLRTMPKRLGFDQFTSGLTLFMIGLVKKTVFADQLSGVVDPVFADPSQHSSSMLALATLAFSLQIYADFSGYTDMARGASRLLGVELRRNFDRPYLSHSIEQFWRRWHMSLSSWLRDYLYRPLGGNRRGLRRTQINLLLTMLIGGLWHGASWNFVIWGGMHGLLLLAHRALPTPAPSRSPVSSTLARIVTFVSVSVLWIFFRAETTSAAVDFVARMLSFEGARPSFDALVTTAVALVGLAIHDIGRGTAAARRIAPSPVMGGLIFGLGMMAVALAAGTPSDPFIYFQF